MSAGCYTLYLICNLWRAGFHGGTISRHDFGYQNSLTNTLFGLLRVILFSDKVRIFFLRFIFLYAFYMYSTWHFKNFKKPRSNLFIICKCLYSDSQKYESSCLSSDRFWCISPEPFELQKIFLPLLASLFEELSDRKRIFQIRAQIHLILRKALIFQRKSQLLKKIRHFEKFKNFFSWI